MEHLGKCRLFHLGNQETSQNMGTADHWFPCKHLSNSSVEDGDAVCLSGIKKKLLTTVGNHVHSPYLEILFIVVSNNSFSQRNSNSNDDNNSNNNNSNNNYNIK